MKKILLLFSIMLCLSGCSNGMLHTIGNLLRQDAAKQSVPAREKVVALDEEAEKEVEKGAANNTDYNVLISNEPESDVEEHITTFIRPLYNLINENLHSYEKQTYGEATMWSDDVYCVKKEYPAGANGSEYARQYYYKGPEGELVFAFVFKGNEEHRLYFKDGKLSRYIDASGAVVNNPSSPEALAMAEKAMEEAN